MNEDIRGAQNIYCGVIENTLRESKDRIVRLRHIDGTDPVGLKLIGTELEEIQDSLIKVMRNIDDIRVLYYDRFGYDSIH